MTTKSGDMTKKSGQPAHGTRCCCVWCRSRKLLHAFPIASPDNQADRLVGHAEGSTKRSYPNARGMQISNQSYFVRSQLNRIHAFPHCLAVLSDFVRIVFLHRPRLQMFRADTQRHIAQVHDLQSDGDRPARQCIRDSVNGLKSTCESSTRMHADVKKTVACIGATGTTTSPNPARGTFLNMFPKLREIDVATVQVVWFRPHLRHITGNSKPPTRLLSSGEKGGDAS